jgi:hypothetical protein
MNYISERTGSRPRPTFMRIHVAAKPLCDRASTASVFFDGYRDLTDAETNSVIRCPWMDEEEQYFAPIQIKEVVPQQNQTTSVQKIV